MENEKEIEENHLLKREEDKLKRETTEALERFRNAFVPADNLKDADLVMSLYEIERWFDGIGFCWDGRKISANLKSIGFEMVYSGSMYLFALKNKV